MGDPNLSTACLASSEMSSSATGAETSTRPLAIAQPRIHRQFQHGGHWRSGATGHSKDSSVCGCRQAGRQARALWPNPPCRELAPRRVHVLQQPQLHGPDWQQVVCHRAKLCDEGSLNRYLHKVGDHRGTTAAHQRARRGIELLCQAPGSVALYEEVRGEGTSVQCDVPAVDAGQW